VNEINGQSHHQKSIGKDKGWRVTAQHDFSSTQKDVISHPGFAGSKLVGQCKPGLRCGLWFLRCCCCHEGCGFVGRVVGVVVVVGQ